MSDPADSLIGRVVAGQYRIRSLLGRGGMGVVYRARDEVLGRDVAVKVIRAASFPQDVQETLRARFRREARAAARLHHPNVISVFSFGSDPVLMLDFMVMELLHGRDLAVELKESGYPPLPRALEILSGALRGVAAGHRVGLVHRDIKPSNLFLSEEQDTGGVHVRVLDFGIAQFLVDEGTQTHLTTFGHTPLSPAYASPEQLRGDTTLTPASDVFSLGATAFELFTGKPAFTPGMRADLSMGQRVKPRSLRKIVPAVPAELDELIRKALSSKPAERFADAEDFLRTLEALPHVPTTASQRDASSLRHDEATAVYRAPVPVREESSIPSARSGKEKLHRRAIRDTLVREYGWDVRSRVEGLVEVRPYTPIVSVVEFREAVLSGVRTMGYQPTLVSERDEQGRTCIQFHTPETLAQSGRGAHDYTGGRGVKGYKEGSFIRLPPAPPRKVQRSTRLPEREDKLEVRGCLSQPIFWFIMVWMFGWMFGVYYAINWLLAGGL